jgi:hypothetical protein
MVSASDAHLTTGLPGTQACRDAYQAQEKTNAACTGYNAAKLGEAVSRATANTAADYVCPARRLF